MKKLTTEDFIEKAKSIHGDKYDYSKSIYTSSINLITIICPTHGEFNQTAQSHYGKKYGCQKCGFEFNTSNTDDFIKKSIKI
jgi:transposase-like protein